MSAYRDSPLADVAEGDWVVRVAHGILSLRQATKTTKTTISTGKETWSRATGRRRPKGNCFAGLQITPATAELVRQVEKHAEQMAAYGLVRKLHHWKVVRKIGSEDMRRFIALAEEILRKQEDDE